MTLPNRLLAFLSIASFLCVREVQARQPQVEGDELVFALPDLNGDVVSSSDARFQGKVVFVTIWGTWCPPCRSEVPTFIDLQQRYGESGLAVVAIAFERDSLAASRRARLREFSEEHRINTSCWTAETRRNFPRPCRWSWMSRGCRSKS
jgi:thiol-disulfide isomerase/thioredoxin